jgi:hypothetical protein
VHREVFGGLDLGPPERQTLLLQAFAKGGPPPSALAL